MESIYVFVSAQPIGVNKVMKSDQIRYKITIFVNAFFNFLPAFLVRKSQFIEHMTLAHEFSYLAD
jgi:hypothetical protein